MENRNATNFINYLGTILENDKKTDQFNHKV